MENLGRALLVKGVFWLSPSDGAGATWQKISCQMTKVPRNNTLFTNHPRATQQGLSRKVALWVD
jgi:hypothetical protein